MKKKKEKICIILVVNSLLVIGVIGVFWGLNTGMRLLSVLYGILGTAGLLMALHRDSEADPDIYKRDVIITKIRNDLNDIIMPELDRIIDDFEEGEIEDAESQLKMLKIELQELIKALEEFEEKL